MARRRRGGGWGQFGADLLANLGDAGVAWAQDQDEEERYQTQAAWQQASALADQHTRRRGKASEVPGMMEGLEEQFPYANTAATRQLLEGATLTPGERSDLFTEDLRASGPDTSQEQLRQMYESAGFEDEWKPLAQIPMRPEYAPGGDVSKAQGLLSGLQDQARLTEDRAIGLAAREAGVTRSIPPQDILYEVKDAQGNPTGEKIPAVLVMTPNEDGQLEGQVLTHDGKVVESYHHSQLQEMLKFMGMDGFPGVNRDGPRPGEGPVSLNDAFGSGTNGDDNVPAGLFNAPTTGSRQAGQTAARAMASAVEDAASGAWDATKEAFQVPEEDFAHEQWSNMPMPFGIGGWTPDTDRFVSAEEYKGIEADFTDMNEQYQWIQRMLQHQDDPRFLPAAQEAMGKLMTHLGNPNIAKYLTDAGKQRILDLLNLFPAGLPHHALTGGAQGGRSTQGPFDPGSTQTRPGPVPPNYGYGMNVPDPTSPAVDPPNVMATGTLGPQTPRSTQRLPRPGGGDPIDFQVGPEGPARQPFPANPPRMTQRTPTPFDLNQVQGVEPSTQVPNIQGGTGGPSPPPFDLRSQQGIPPSTQVPNIQGGRPGPRPPLSRELDIQTPMTPRQPLPQTTADPRGRPQRGPGGPPDIQGGLTPRQPFPPSGPEMTQRPQGPPRFDLERALPRPPSPSVLPQIEGGIEQLPAPPPGMPGFRSQDSVTVTPGDPGGVTVPPPTLPQGNAPPVTPVNPNHERMKRNTRGGWRDNDYQMPTEHRERVDHNAENILGGNASYQAQQAVTNWLESQIYVESRGRTGNRARDISPDGAIGLMQVISDEALADVVDSPYWDAEMQADWDALGTGITFPTDLSGKELKVWMNEQNPGYRKRIDDALFANPDFSLEVGTNYLKVLAKKPSGSYNFQDAPNPLMAIILAYHQGGGAVRKWINSGAAGDMQRNPDTLAFDGIEKGDSIGPEGWAYVQNVMNQINPAEEAIINDLIKNQWRYE